MSCLRGKGFLVMQECGAFKVMLVEDDESFPRTPAEILSVRARAKASELRLSCVNDKERERRTKMEFAHLKERVIGQFVIVLNEQGSQTLNLHQGRPLLYLKSWGSDYPCLQGVGEQRRWLPVPVDSKPGI
jgi:hypothetical protein